MEMTARIRMSICSSTIPLVVSPPLETLHWRVSKKDPNCLPSVSDKIIDIGAYQGMFLNAAHQAWGVEGVAYDFSESGIEFARNVFGFKNSKTLVSLTVFISSWVYNVSE